MHSKNSLGVVLFSSIIFLILVLLLVNISLPEFQQDWFFSPLSALLIGLAAYAAVLGLIIFQNTLRKKWKKRKRGRMLALANIELLLFFCIFYYVLGVQRIFTDSPSLSQFQILPTLFILFLYLAGIFTFHLSAHSSIRKEQTDWHVPWDNAMLQMRLIVPFAVPFLLYTLILDVLSLLPWTEDKGISAEHFAWLHMGEFVAGSLVFAILVMIFLPALIQAVWKCKSMENKGLEERLEKVCHRAHFRHAGIKTWTIMQDSLTAAILGIVPRFRYIIFTKRLLKEFSPESLEAILAHEIGHNYRKHLLIFPFIISGMVVCTGLFAIYFSTALQNFLLLGSSLHPSFIWKFLGPFFLFMSYAVVFGLYIRLVFGYFSRLFERQADLHVYHLQVSPQNLIHALDHIGIATGYSHRVPNWHHFSIQQRIDFLNETIENPTKIAKHHRLVGFSLIGYFAFLIAGILILIAPLFPNSIFFQRIHVQNEALSEQINRGINHSLYYEQAKKLIIENGLKGNTPLILDILVDSLQQTGGMNAFPIEGFHASEMLFEQGEISASSALLAQVWKSLTIDDASDHFIENLNRLHDRIASRISQNETYQREAEEIKEGRLQALKKLIKSPPLEEKHPQW